MPNDYEQLKMRVAELENQIRSFTNPADYDAERVAGLNARIGGVLATQSVKTANSEDVTVDESGASTYTVMNDCDLFLKVTISGTVYYIPAFTS